MAKGKKNSGANITPEQITALLDEHPDRSFSFKQIAEALGVSGKSAKVQLTQALEQVMAGNGVLLRRNEANEANEAVDRPAPPDNTLVGVVEHVNPRFAFIVSDESEQDTKIDTDQLMGAHDGDTVRVAVYPASKRQRSRGGRGNNPEGEVVEILERGRTEYVGKIEISERHAFVIPDGRRMYDDIFVRSEHIGHAHNNDKVVVRITEWPEGKFSPVGEVIEVLGPAGAHNTEMHAIMAEFGLPFQFPEGVEQEAESISDQISQEEVARRRDMRDVLTFTIDPVDAKDFDDALSVRKLDGGDWEVGVHIADVTHYVHPETDLEREAHRRATSVYLVDRVVPMLPERLSNGLCSLRPHEDKLCFSAVFRLDERARVRDEWFGRTVIHSDHRFAYEDAQKVLDGHDDRYTEVLLKLNQLAYKLREERFKRGAIGFETTEVRFKLNDEGVPLAVVPKVRQDAHKLIEEFMLLANKRVAEFVYHARKDRKKNTLVYRVHESPDPDKLSTFANFAGRFGYTIETEGKAASLSLNRMMTNLEGKPEEELLQNLAIRTMSKARYTVEPLGHFGLAFPHYTHFTSPIRRYPDMMVHRMLQHYLDGGDPLAPGPWEKLSRHASEMERRAVEAERASVKYKQVEFTRLQDPDKVYEGIVSGVAEHGIYVEMTETRCEGMVRMSDIDGDYYELDPENYRALGRRTQQIIAFGDPVRVRVIDTNMERRIIDLAFADTKGGTSGNGGRQQNGRRPSGRARSGGGSGGGASKGRSSRGKGGRKQK
ncbi:MAG: ribonuclease R [Catalinimonas sp.]